jgi:hypothetical protein
VNYSDITMLLHNVYVVMCPYGWFGYVTLKMQQEGPLVYDSKVIPRDFEQIMSSNNYIFSLL